VIPRRPLIHEPWTLRIRRFAENHVQRGVVEVAEVDRQALGWAELAANLLHRRSIAALRLHPSADGHSEDGVQRWRLPEDGVFDIDRANMAVVPLRDLGWSLLVGQPLLDRGREQSIPVGVLRWQPAGGLVDDDLLFGVELLAPAVEIDRIVFLDRRGSLLREAELSMATVPSQMRRMSAAWRSRFALAASCVASTFEWSIA